MALPRENRLKRTTDFQTVFQKGRSVRQDGILLKAVPSKKANCRFGIVVAKSVAKKAVIRNRIRRLFTEALRKEKDQLKKTYDIILVALPGIEPKNALDAQRQIHCLFKKALLLKTK